MSLCTTIIPYTPFLSPEVFIRQEVERAQAAASVDSRSLPLSKENKIFLLEGSRSESSISKFPELSLAKKLASLNEIGLFDCIHSFDQLHLSKFLALQSVRDHKKIAVYIVSLFASAGGISDIIDSIIKPGFMGLVRENIYTTVPEWLETLKNNSIFLEALKEIERSFTSKDKMQADYDIIKKTLSNTSNQISAESFLKYLKEHSEIREVYGMMGLGHISFLDEHAVMELGGSERHLQIRVLDRIVDVHLFGGAHGELAHYEKMSSFVAERGLSLPPEPGEIDGGDLAELRLLVQTLLASDSSQRRREIVLDHPRHEERKSFSHEERKSGSSLPSRLDEASRQFDYWMKRYNHFGKKTHAERLLDWLHCDSDGELIENFDQFIALARKLDGNGYEIIIMPTRDQFDEAMRICIQKREKLRERFGGYRY